MKFFELKFELFELFNFLQMNKELKLTSAEIIGSILGSTLASEIDNYNLTVIISNVDPCLHWWQ